MQFFDSNSLDKYKEILFGPSLMEIGWELFRWSPFIRWYKKTHPNKKIISVTRHERLDLYYDVADEISTFKIDGDYDKYRPNMYRLDFYPEQLHANLINRYKRLYKKAFIFEPPDTNNRHFFNPLNMDYSITPNPANEKIISDIINKHKDRIPIVISPRHRIDMRIKHDRNWRLDYWFNLFTLIRDTKKYLVFIAGSSPSFARPCSMECFITLEELTGRYISNIGVTVEAIKASKLTIGNQSAIPVLSNYLKTPTLFWGHEKQRHQVIENPLNTPCEFILEHSMNYSTHPEIIFNKIEELIENG